MFTVTGYCLNHLKLKNEVNIYSKFIILYNLIPLNQPSDVRDLVEDGVVHLVVVQLTFFPKCLHEILADPTEECQDSLVGKELLTRFLHRDNLLHDFDTELARWHRANLSTS